MVVSHARKCPIDLNTYPSEVNLNALPLGSYDVLVGMDWLEKHGAIINYLEKTISCVNEDKQKQLIKGIPKPISIRNILALPLKKSARKGC